MRLWNTLFALLLSTGIVNAGQVTVFSENFESTLAGWSLTGDWQAGTPSIVGPTAAFQGTKCAGTIIAGYYSTSGTSIMMTPPFQVPSTATAVTFSYYEWYSTASSYDYLYVEASINSGSTWSTVRSGLSGSGSVWTQRTFDLTSYKNNNVMLRFRFVASSSGYSYPGWYIDSLKVVATVIDTANLPHIAVAPGSFKIGSHDSAAKTLTICNTGINDTLQYSISSSGATPNILTWTYGASTSSSAYTNTVSSILAQIPNAKIASTATTDAATLSTLLQSTDVFLIPAQEYTSPSSTVGSAFSPVLDTYVRSGGVVIVLAPYYESTFLQYAGLDTLSYSNYTSSSYTVSINVPTNPVFDSVASLTTQSVTSYWTRTSAASVLATYSSYAVCSERQKGNGYIYMIGYDFYSVNTTTWGKVLANCIKRNSSGGIVTADTASGLVKPSGCKTVKLTFRRTGLPPGNNITLLKVRHNALLDANPVTVPCTLSVDSSEVPHITVAPGSFRIGAADPLVKTLTICNTGTRDTLRYTVTGAPNILSWTYGTGSYSTYTNTVSSILALIPNAKITSTMTTDPATLATQLQNASIFLIPSQEYTTPTSTIGSAFAPVLDSYVRSGGIVIVLMPYYESTFLQYAGLDTLSYSNYTSSSGSVVTITSPSHPMFDSVPSLLTQSYTGYWTRTSASTILATYSGYTACSERQKGSGFIYMIGYNFYSVNTTTWGRVLANCIKKNSTGGAVTADTASGWVKAGGCKTVKLTFRRDGLAPGTIVVPLKISHNAPLNVNPVSVACTLLVDSTTMSYQAPSMSVAVFTGDTAVRAMTVQNTGSSMLNFSIVKSSNGPQSILINEVNSYSQWIELLNAGAGDVNIGGYRLIWTDNVGTSGSYTMPANTMIRSHRCVVFVDGTGIPNDSLLYVGTVLNWSYSTDLSVSLVNASGLGVDFFKTSGDAANPPSGTTWTGPGVYRYSSTYNYYRTTIADSNSAGGWVAATSSSYSYPYVLNPGQSFLTPVSIGYITVRSDSLSLGAAQTSSIRFKYDASSLMKAGIFIDTFQIIHNAKNLKSPVAIICTLTVRSNIPDIIPVKPNPTVQRKPTLKWHPVVNASAYTVEISQGPSFSTLWVIQQTADTAFTSILNFPLGDIYWRVRCDLNQKASLPDHFYIQNDSIPVIIPMPDSIVQQSNLKFRWYKSTGATSYKISLTRIDTLPQQQVIITFATDTFYVDAAMITKGLYTWTVSSNFDYTRFSYPDTFRVTLPIAVIPRFQAKLPTAFGVSAYEVAGGLRIMCAVPARAEGMSPNVSLDLFDVRGKLVRKIYNGVLLPGYHQFPIVSQQAASGVYYCRMRAGTVQKMAPVYLKK
jgi:hypothetical protein